MADNTAVADYKRNIAAGAGASAGWNPPASGRTRMGKNRSFIRRITNAKYKYRSTGKSPRSIFESLHLLAAERESYRILAGLPAALLIGRLKVAAHALAELRLRVADLAYQRKNKELDALLNETCAEFYDSCKGAKTRTGASWKEHREEIHEWCGVDAAESLTGFAKAHHDIVVLDQEFRFVRASGERRKVCADFQVGQRPRTSAQRVHRPAGCWMRLPEHVYLADA